MSRADFRVSTGFFTHPKTQKLRRRLGDTGVLALLRLWAFTAENRTKGVLSGYDAEDLAIAAGWEGGAVDLLDALTDLGWLDQTDEGYAVHDWKTHQPWIYHAEQRSERARLAASARWASEENQQDNAPRMPDACAEHAASNAKSESSNAPSPTPSPTPTPSPGISTPDGVEGDSQGPPPCPHEKILEIYHAALPQCRQMRVWNKTRRGYLQARWREDPERQSIDWWEKFLSYVARSDFLTGKIPGRNGEPPFMVDLEWLVRPQNFAKVIEGKYHKGAA